MTHQMALNLCGEVPTPEVIVGEEIDERKICAMAEEAKDFNMLFMMKSYMIHASFWFGNYDRVIDLMHETNADSGGYKAVVPSMFGLYHIYLHCALACISIASSETDENTSRLPKDSTKSYHLGLRKATPMLCITCNFSKQTWLRSEGTR